ncbi:hypothetical protein [Streptomyces sp. NPDC047928]|uniref:hypothetical protein n=1 Tax=unclassified Streptomyces TaxID=2593676 RepID=UPI003714843F
MPFDEELGAAMRRTGDSFTTDDGNGLVTGGVARGRRRVMRRRVTAVTGSALALALVGVGGAYLNGTLGQGGDASVAAAPTPVGQVVVGDGKVGSADLITLFKELLPQGELTGTTARGTDAELGPMVSGVFDDGKGKAAIGVGFFRSPGTDAGFADCPDKVFTPYDACTAETLANGARLVMLQGYEYPDKREETKNWRATLLLKDGLVIDASEWNAPAQKGAAVTRPEPPLSPEQMKALVTSGKWEPVLDSLRNAGDAKKPGDDGEPASAGVGDGTPGDGDGRGFRFDAAGVGPTFMSLLPKDLDVTAESHDGEFAYAVVDDGKGKSLIQVNAQPDMSDVADQLFQPGAYTTLPDGTKVAVARKTGEKAAVVWWSVDTMRPDGYRVVVSAFNTGAQHEPATRAEPALSMEQLQAIATSDRWLKLKK